MHMDRPNFLKSFFKSVKSFGWIDSKYESRRRKKGRQQLDPLEVVGDLEGRKLL